jgi:hypothetical protein
MRSRSIALTIALALLGSCGGGSNGPEVPLTTTTGVVFADAPLVGYSVTVYTPAVEIPGQPLNPAAPPATSAWLAIGTSGSDGRYSATSFMGTHRPFVIEASAPFTPNSATLDERQYKYRNLNSISHRGGDVNVTPLTELLVARLLNRTPSSNDFLPVVLQNRTEDDVSAAHQQVVAYLLNRPGKDDGNVTSPVDVSALTDFASMPLNTVPGDPHFDALKRFHDSLMDSENVQGVDEHMLFGNDPPADLRAMLSLDFMANCTPNNGIANNGMAPSGPTRVILDRRAIALGSVELAFQTGDQLRIEGNARSGNYTWTFSSATGQASAELTIVAGRLTRVAALFSTCFPQSEVSLSGKHPSVFGFIGLLSQSLDLSREFQCAGPITWPGFLATPDPNFLFFDQKGAVRINGLSSPSLHLPSMAVFSIDAAPLVVTAGEVSPIRLTSFQASFAFSSSISFGFDAFEVRLTDTGQITGLSLTNAHSQQAQHCGI